MRIGSTFNVAFRALRRNKLRSALTALGIIIGVGAVIAMVGIGNGAKAQVEAQIASLGRKRHPHFIRQYDFQWHSHRLGRGRNLENRRCRSNPARSAKRYCGQRRSSVPPRRSRREIRTGLPGCMGESAGLFRYSAVAAGGRRSVYRARRAQRQQGLRYRTNNRHASFRQR